MVLTLDGRLDIGKMELSYLLPMAAVRLLQMVLLYPAAMYMWQDMTVMLQSIGKMELPSISPMAAVSLMHLVL